MLARSEKEFIELFNTIEEPRDDSKVLYPVAEILFLCLMGVLSCAESWAEIIQYGKTNIDFLRHYFPFKNGLPSKSVLSRVFGMIDPKEMADFLMRFIAIFNAEGEIIALDGKRLRGSDVHLLHVFATRQGIVLTQKMIENKVNESPEIPGVLDKLAINGAVITADALNCQKEIVNKIREKKADYFFAVKGNQPSLFEDIKLYFEKCNKAESYEESDKGHGRVELRKCWSTNDTEWLQRDHPDWKDLKSIAMVYSERLVKGKTEQEFRYYISNTTADPKKHLTYSREHWQVENNLHWILDVVFKEDHATLGERAAHNMAAMRKLVLNMIKRYKAATGDKTAIKSMRKAASWSNEVAAKLLKYLVAS